MNNQNHTEEHNEVFYMKQFIARTLTNLAAMKDKWSQAIALEFLFELAKNYDNKALIIIGDLHAQGFEPWFPKDINRAIHYYIKAIREGVLFGYECIGMILFNRGKSDIDYERAYKCFLAVIINGGELSFGADYALAEMYKNGLYVEKNLDKAIYHYKRILTSKSEFRMLDEFYALAQKQYEELKEKLS